MSVCFAFQTARLARIRWWCNALCIVKISFQQGDVEFQFFMCRKTGVTIIFLCHEHQNGSISKKNKVGAKKQARWSEEFPNLSNC